jgi:hypothetical protein
MKKLTYFVILFIVAVVLTACGTGDNWEVKFNEPLYVTKGKESTVEIKVTEDNKPLTDLNVKAQFEMTSMSHGTVNLKLDDKGDGIYQGKAVFPMAGGYTATFTMKKEGYTIEKVLEVEAEKAEGVALINGEPINTDDLEFYRFINMLHIAINREADQQTYQGKELEERMAYWDSQAELNKNNNQLLTQIIRLRSMAILAEEKGHTATKEEVDKEVANIRDKYNQSEVASSMIKDFGEGKFWNIEKKQYEYIVLTQKVQQDVKDKVKKENPSVGEQEINFLAQKEYEELLVSQVGSMKIEIL